MFSKPIFFVHVNNRSAIGKILAFLFLFKKKNSFGGGFQLVRAMGHTHKSGPACISHMQTTTVELAIVVMTRSYSSPQVLDIIALFQHTRVNIVSFVVSFSGINTRIIFSARNAGE